VRLVVGNDYTQCDAAQIPFSIGLMQAARVRQAHRGGVFGLGLDEALPELLGQIADDLEARIGDGEQGLGVEGPRWSIFRSYGVI